MFDVVLCGLVCRFAWVCGLSDLVVWCDLEFGGDLSAAVWFGCVSFVVSVWFVLGIVLCFCVVWFLWGGFLVGYGGLGGCVFVAAQVSCRVGFPVCCYNMAL